MSSPADEYRAVLARLTALDAAAAGHRAEAVAWHDGRVAAAGDALRAADDTVREAAAAVRAAQRDLEEVDARAAGLWSDFVHRVGPAAERFGRTVPQPALPRQRSALSADDYLQEVAAKIGWTPPARPLTGATTTVFAVFGAIGGVLGMAAHQLLRWAGAAAGGDWAVALPVVALIALVLGPVIAVFAAKRVADRRGAELNAAAVTTVLVAGLVTAGLLVGALRGF
ncbi:hypothetical protein [Krasilnikovia sp. MM14-A1259]|uniref:hypothetical protein n=1 Tax=Krasilnikovia sp. MM14-A1259 TaxID=3373539 RepID=UPI0037FDBE8B